MHQSENSKRKRRIGRNNKNWRGLDRRSKERSAGTNNLNLKLRSSHNVKKKMRKLREPVSNPASKKKNNKHRERKSSWNRPSERLKR